MTHHELLLAAADRLDCADGADGNCDMEPPCSEYATALRALAALAIPAPRPAREVADEFIRSIGNHLIPTYQQSKAIILELTAAIEADRLSRDPAAALLITGPHPTCPACESLVLPTGMCVNGCSAC